MYEYHVHTIVVHDNIECCTTTQGIPVHPWLGHAQYQSHSVYCDSVGGEDCVIVWFLRPPSVVLSRGYDGCVQWRLYPGGVECSSVHPLLAPHMSTCCGLCCRPAPCQLCLLCGAMRVGVCVPTRGVCAEQCDLGTIEALYERKRGKSLIEAVKGDTSGTWFSLL